MTRITIGGDPAHVCDKSLNLRHKVQKLRWMGLEREADQVVGQIGEITCDLPIAVAGIDLETD